MRNYDTVATLESFIIDTFTTVKDGIERPDGRGDQIGGAGTYAIMGARIFLPPSNLLMIIDYTPTTVPPLIRTKLESYGEVMWAWRERKDGLGVCRGLNRYDGEVRQFEYLVPPIHVTPKDILKTYKNLWHSSKLPQRHKLPSWLHLVSYPPRTEEIIAKLKELKMSSPEWVPKLIWEPEPPCAVPENLEALTRIIPYTDIVSPNHTEVAALFSILLPSEQPTSSTSSHTDSSVIHLIERATAQLAVLRPKIGAIVRAGPLGCCYALTTEIKVETQNTYGKDGHRIPVYWCPAYWGVWRNFIDQSLDTNGEESCREKVVDPTGGGNAFMGGLMAAFARGKDIHEAVVWANVAASFVIEQNGLPRITSSNINAHGIHDSNGLNEGKKTLVDEEYWNDDLPARRVDELRQQVSAVGNIVKLPFKN